MAIVAPYFSFIIPSYNRAESIGLTIESIIKQQFEDLEIIVVDDGSTDNTNLVVQEFKDERIKYYRIENSERGAARNYGCKRAQSVYLNFFDSDDILLPCLETLYSFIQKSSEPPIVYGEIELLSEGKLSSKEMLPLHGFASNLLFNNFLACGSVFIKREVALANPFNEDRRLSSAEDWELWLRISCTYKFTPFGKPTFLQVQHSSRSLNSIAPKRAIERELFFYYLVDSNPSIMATYGKDIFIFLADRYTFVALMHAIENGKALAFSFLIKAIKLSLKVFARKRFWAVIKKVAFT